LPFTGGSGAAVPRYGDGLYDLMRLKVPVQGLYVVGGVGVVWQPTMFIWRNRSPCPSMSSSVGATIARMHCYEKGGSLSCGRKCHGGWHAMRWPMHANVVADGTTNGHECERRINIATVWFDGVLCDVVSTGVVTVPYIIVGAEMMGWLPLDSRSLLVIRAVVSTSFPCKKAQGSIDNEHGLPYNL